MRYYKYKKLRISFYKFFNINVIVIEQMICNDIEQIHEITSIIYKIYFITQCN